MAKGRAVAIVLGRAEQRVLTGLTRKHGAPQAIAERACMVLAAADGLKNKEIVEKLVICAHTVGVWRNRFADARMMASMTSLARARRAGSVTTRSPPPS